MFELLDLEDARNVGGRYVPSALIAYNVWDFLRSRAGYNGSMATRSPFVISRFLPGTAYDRGFFTVRKYNRDPMVNFLLEACLGQKRVRLV